MEIDSLNLEWLGHASFRISIDNKTLYIDPYQITNSNPTPADVILITHEHKDHCKKVTINRLSNKKTAILGPKKCSTEIEERLRILNINEVIEYNNFKITAFPAYNTPE